MKIMNGNMGIHIVSQQGHKKGRWIRTQLVIGEIKMMVYNIYVPLETDGGGSTTIRRQLQNSLDAEGIEEEPVKHLYR